MAHCWLIRPDAQHIHHVVKVPKLLERFFFTADVTRIPRPRDAMATLTALARTEEGQTRKVFSSGGSIPSMTRMLDQLVEVIATPTGQPGSPLTFLLTLCRSRRHKPVRVTSPGLSVA